MPSNSDTDDKIKDRLVVLSTVSEISTSRHGVRRRRADAERSIAAILDAAAHVLAQQPQASVEAIAKAAGISRQTVYVHFPSRDVLLSALIDRASDRVAAALDAADFDSGSASEALVRLLEISWQTYLVDSFLLTVSAPPPNPSKEREQHEPVLQHLERLIARGQREGDFDPDLPVNWILAATVALGHAAGEEVRSGRMTADQAKLALRQGLPRLFRR